MGWKEVGSDLKRHLSATQVAMFQRCPLQYKFRYVDGKKIPPNSGLVVGISVHRGIEKNYAHKYATKKPENRNVVMDAFDREWKSFQKSEVDFEGKNPGQEKDMGYRMLGVHFDKLAPSVQPIEKPEYAFEVAIPGVKRKFVGYIDVLAKVLSIPLAVLDHKTTRRRFTQWGADLSVQLTSYAYAIRSIFKKAPIVGMDVLAEKKHQVEEQRLLSTRDAGALGRFEYTVQSIEKAIDQGTFYPTDQQMTCSWCGYNTICHASAVKSKDARKFNV